MLMSPTMATRPVLQVKLTRAYFNELFKLILSTEGNLYTHKIFIGILLNSAIALHYYFL